MRCSTKFTTHCDTPARIIAMGGLTPDSVRRLRPYAEEGKLYAIVAESAVTRSRNPYATIDQFCNEIEKLPSLSIAQDTQPLVTRNPIAPSVVNSGDGSWGAARPI
jgi:hypothetical protein